MRSKSLLPLWIFEGIEDSKSCTKEPVSFYMPVRWVHNSKSPWILCENSRLLFQPATVRQRSSKAIHIHSPSSTAVLVCSYLFVACVQIRPSSFICFARNSKSPRIPCKNSRPPSPVEIGLAPLYPWVAQHCSSGDPISWFFCFLPLHTFLAFFL
jgi:hypothetical protein